MTVDEGKLLKRVVRETGRVMEWFGVDAEALAALLPHLATHFAGVRDGRLDTARVYAEGGLGATDPRTDAAVPRLKDVLSGKLDPLLEAWRRHTAPATQPLPETVSPCIRDARRNRQ